MQALAQLRQLMDYAKAYGFEDWLVVDASVVRGLAYYTGVVFEAFDKAGTHPLHIATAQHRMSRQKLRLGYLCRLP